jgi:hypothetical protein
MVTYSIKETEDTPAVTIDYEAGIFEISGKSLPEDSVGFYIPVDSALRKYIDNPKPKTTINLRLTYLNSSSQKRILELVSLFRDLSEKDMDLKINWYYSKDDEDMFEEGKDFVRLISLPVNIIQT